MDRDTNIPFSERKSLECKCPIVLSILVTEMYQDYFENKIS